MRYLILFRVFLVISIGLFVAFHTSVFIHHIEPNLYLSWLCAIAIEGMLVSLAIMQTRYSKVLIIPLFLVSVLSASFSFIVKNEDILNSFLSSKKAIELLQKDLQQTREELQTLSNRYTTKSLQRERKIKDMMLEYVTSNQGEMVLMKSIVFLILIFVLQLSSLYTAASLKVFLVRNENGTRLFLEQNRSENGTETVSETLRNTLTVSENSITERVLETEQKHSERNIESSGTEMEQVNKVTKKDVKKKLKEIENDQFKDFNFDIEDVVKRLKHEREKRSLTELAKLLSVSRSTLSKMLAYPKYPVSVDAYKAVYEALKSIYIDREKSI